MIALAITTVLPLLAIAGAMWIYDQHQSAQWSRRRRSKVGKRWLQIVPDLAQEHPSGVRHVRMGPPRQYGFFRPEIRR